MVNMEDRFYYSDRDDKRLAGNDNRPSSFGPKRFIPRASASRMDFKKEIRNLKNFVQLIGKIQGFQLRHWMRNLKKDYMRSENEEDRRVYEARLVEVWGLVDRLEELLDRRPPSYDPACKTIEEVEARMEIRDLERKRLNEERRLRYEQRLVDRDRQNPRPTHEYY